MSEITVKDVAEALTAGDNEWINDEVKAAIWAEGDVVHIETKEPQPRHFWAPVFDDANWKSLIDEPKGSFAVVLDAMGDAWQKRSNGLWACAIGGGGNDYWSAWSWEDLVNDRVLTPLTLLHPGYNDDQEV